MSRCVVCGSYLRTGRKYCWRCRNSHLSEDYLKRKRKDKAYNTLAIFLTGLVIFIMTYFMPYDNICRLVRIFSFMAFILGGIGVLAQMCDKKRKEKFKD